MVIHTRDYLLSENEKTAYKRSFLIKILQFAYYFPYKWGIKARKF
ncbi:hypothetical protein X874_15270 [Mannheimia varigena USDA-ARS-USMARC-1312]|uniref:Uncharacterized protein n=1 Tax=Mannheimia varigena USDA-ARS-USMARC-1296 TaxID=1433287 RepID=W0QFW4_9PAST|nr:hypothetical protein X808_16330 [Mannheimia varigena USDA-ARS-USMARC-1296]AHG78161.1 hypothetical protein X874_15270 [Mannheimia varigena USDA-ARS-USMARC-1312]